VQPCRSGTRTDCHEGKISMNWYLKVIKNYAGFSGRARRKEYWMFALISAVISIALGIVDGVMATGGQSGVGVLGLVYSVAVLLPSLGVSVRRLHDTNRSGWWLLIALIPILGAIALLVFVCSAGTAGDNRFGSDPKADEGGGVMPAMA
jgi:uncharacterized membrane protein YhaH (DUF805 family)